jgi:hypothetical protein
MREAMSALAADLPLEFSLRQRNAVLAPVVAVLLSQRPRLRVLDFGGGPGLGYVALRAAVPGLVPRIDYVVVERVAVCAVAPSFGEETALSFRTDIPADEAFDVVHAASVLQYIDRREDAIGRLVACGPAATLSAASMTRWRYYEAPAVLAPPRGWRPVDARIAGLAINMLSGTRLPVYGEGTERRRAERRNGAAA